jgi:hypothetical protein
MEDDIPSPTSTKRSSPTDNRLLSSTKKRRLSLSEPALLPTSQYLPQAEPSLPRNKPYDPKEPGPLSNLSPELRVLIYQHYIHLLRGHRDSCYMMSKCNHFALQTPDQLAFPPLLHVSRAIREEVAYEFYTSTHFHFLIAPNRFGWVRKWVATLPARHLDFLSKNVGVELQLAHVSLDSQELEAMPYRIKPGSSDMYTEFKIENAELLETAMVSWEGNRAILRHLCELLEWFTFCSKDPISGIKWRYTNSLEVKKFHVRAYNAYYREVRGIQKYHYALWQRTLSTLLSPWMDLLPVSVEDKRTMVKEAVNMQGYFKELLHEPDPEPPVINPWTGERDVEYERVQRLLAEWARLPESQTTHSEPLALRLRTYCSTATIPDEIFQALAPE